MPRDDDDERVQPRRPRDEYDDRPPAPRRRRDEYDDDDRPARRERRRYDDEDEQAPRRKGGKGLLIGLLLGGGGILLAGGAIVLVLILSSGLKSKIIGTWQDDKGITYEFTASETLLVSMPRSKPLNATYKVDGNVIELTATDPLDKNKRIVDRIKAEISGTELTLSYGPSAKSPPLKLQRLR